MSLRVGFEVSKAYSADDRSQLLLQCHECCHAPTMMIMAKPLKLSKPPIHRHLMKTEESY